MEPQSTIPPPPEGFAPVAATPDVPPPPPGFAPVAADPSTPPQHWYDTAVTELGDLSSGFKTALNQTGETAMNVVGKSGLNRLPGWQRSAAQTHDIASAPLDTPGKMAGAAIENIIEFAAGDEALKGLSTAAKFAELSKVEQALKKSPVLTRMLGNAVRAQAVGTTQAAAHGASGGEAVATGSLAALGGAALEGLAEGGKNLLSILKPSTEMVMGEPMPVLASQKPKASSLAQNVASISSEPAIATAQQEASQRAITNRAQAIAERELHKLNAARANRWREFEGTMNLAPKEQPGTAPRLTSGAPQLEATTEGVPRLEAGEQPSGVARTDEVGAYEGDFPEQPQASTPATPKPQGQKVQYIQEVGPNFDPIDAKTEAVKVRSFGEAADKIREHASPIFDTFDKATNGEYMRLRNIRDEAYASGDYAGVRNAENAIDKLFDMNSLRGKIDRLEYRTVKSAWRTNKVLDAVHDAVARSLNIQNEEMAAFAKDDDVWRGISGSRLQGGLNRLTGPKAPYTMGELKEVLGEDTLRGLQKMASRLQSPRYATEFGQKVGDVANEVLLQGEKKLPLIPAHVLYARNKLLHQLAINPRASSVIDYAVKNKLAAATTARVLTGIIGNQWARESNEPEPGQEQPDAGSN